MTSSYHTTKLHKPPCISSCAGEMTGQRDCNISYHQMLENCCMGHSFQKSLTSVFQYKVSIAVDT